LVGVTIVILINSKLEDLNNIKIEFEFLNKWLKANSVTEF